MQAVLHQPVVARALGCRRVLVLLPLETFKPAAITLSCSLWSAARYSRESVGERVIRLGRVLSAVRRHRVLIQRELGEVDAVGVPDAMNHLRIGDGEDWVEAAELGAAALRSWCRHRAPRSGAAPPRAPTGRRRSPR